MKKSKQIPKHVLLIIIGFGGLYPGLCHNHTFQPVYACDLSAYELIFSFVPQLLDFLPTIILLHDSTPLIYCLIGANNAM